MAGDKEMPKITVAWDADKQAVHIDFDRAELKTWNFVIGLLTMALETAKVNEQLARLAAMQQQAMAEQMGRRVMQGAIIPGR